MYGAGGPPSDAQSCEGACHIQHKYRQCGLSTHHGLQRTELETSCPACRSAALRLHIGGGLEQEDGLIQPPLHLDRRGDFRKAWEACWL